MYQTYDKMSHVSPNDSTAATQRSDVLGVLQEVDEPSCGIHGRIATKNTTSDGRLNRGTSTS